MARPTASLLALGLALVAALGLAACGEEDAQLLGGETAREITANLDTVRQLADEGDCIGAESAAEQVGEQIDELEEVDPRLKRALEEGAERLEEVIATCEGSVDEAIGPAQIPEEEDDEEEKEDKPQKDGGKGKGQGSGGGGETEAEAESPAPSESEGEAKGKGPEGEGPPGQSEGGEEEQSGGLGPGSAVEEGE